MYRDPCRWSVPFQSQVAITLLNLHNQPQVVKLLAILFS